MVVAGGEGGWGEAEESNGGQIYRDRRRQACGGEHAMQ